MAVGICVAVAVGIGVAVAAGIAVAVNVAVAVLVGVGMGVAVFGIAVGVSVGLTVADGVTVAVVIVVDTAVGVLVINADDWAWAVDTALASVGDAAGFIVNAGVLTRAGVEVATVVGVAVGVAVRVGVWDGVKVGEGAGVAVSVGKGTGVAVCVIAVDTGAVFADNAAVDVGSVVSCAAPLGCGETSGRGVATPVAGAVVGVGGCKSRTSIGAGGVAVFGGTNTTVAVAVVIVGRAMGRLAGGVVLHAASAIQAQRITAASKLQFSAPLPIEFSNGRPVTA